MTNREHRIALMECKLHIAHCKALITLWLRHNVIREAAIELETLSHWQNEKQRHADAINLPRPAKRNSEAEVLKLARAGERIAAIKLYRSTHDCDLRGAINAVDTMLSASMTLDRVMPAA